MDLAYNLRLLKEIFFPRHCAVCASEIDTGLVCDKCRKHFCLNKVIQYGANQASWEEVVTVSQRLTAPDVFGRIELLYKYDSAFKDALHSLKFEANKELLPLLKEEAEIALISITDTLVQHYDLVTSIPTSDERRKKRGFDVPQVIFSSLKKGFGAKYTDKLMYRVRNTEPLYTMGAEDRKAELSGCFAMLSNFEVKDKRILLVDDIWTTGSTMQEAAELLLQAGAKEIGALAFCTSKDNWD